MYAVVGATGNVGNALTKALIAKGKAVRALHRDAAKEEGLRALGAEPVLASVEDAARLEIAFRDAEGVFIMTPPFYKSHDPRNENALAVAALAHATRAAHVSKVVLLSSIGAEQDHGTGAILKLHDLEKGMERPGLCLASIRAAYFMENFKPLLGYAKEHGKLPIVMSDPDQPWEMVSTQDIAALAAELLVDGWKGQLTVELGGPRLYSMNDAASIIGKAVGRAVQTEVVPPEHRQAFFEHAGFTAASAASMVAMSQGFDAGRIAFHGQGAECRKGPTPLEAVVGAA